MERTINIFETPNELAVKFAGELVELAAGAAKGKRPLCISLSGGSTPELLFTVLGERFGNSVNWANIHFFWGDERCVSPDDPASNFGMARRTLFNRIDIPEPNLHRIKGENDPVNEAFRYSLEIAEFTTKRESWPVFDLVILGLGEDGHTASIFPSNISLLSSSRICEVARHPVTSQVRVTITGKVINNARKIAFLVTGSNKAAIVEKLLKKESPEQNYPASGIVPSYGELSWFLDREAAAFL